MTPENVIAKRPLQDLQKALAASGTLYGADGLPIQAGPADPFGGRQFPPGQPLTPALPPGTDPRAWFPWTGYNLAYVPRSEFGAVLTPFQMLRNLADLCDIVRICIEDVKQQILGFSWDIKAKDDSTQTLEAEVKDVKRLLRRPDGKHDFPTWLGMLMEEALVTDAVSIYRQRTELGDPYGLILLDGATIKPLVDFRGLSPDPPFPAYQQIIQGTVESEFTEAWHTADPFQPDGEQKHELIYLPFSRRTHNPYGHSPVERVIMTVNLILRRQQHYLAFYTDGTIPEAFWKCPEDWTAEQIRTAQEMFDMLLSGNLALRSRLRLMPGGEGTGLEDPRSHSAWTYEFEEWLARVVAWCFQVSPLPVAKLMNRATSEQADVGETDSGTKPLKKRLANLINTEIEEFFGYDTVEFHWTDEKGEDERLKLDKNLGYYAAGIYTREEVRDSEGRQPLTQEQIAELDGYAPRVPGGVPGQGGAPGSAGDILAAAPPIPILGRAAVADLQRWRKVAVKDVRTGRPPRRFETRVIPGPVRIALAEWLGHARTPEDVAWGFRYLTRARRPIVSARKRIRLERALRAAVRAHFDERAPVLARLVGRYYTPPAAAGQQQRAESTPPDDEIDQAMDWPGFRVQIGPSLANAYYEGSSLAEDVAGIEQAFGLTDEQATAYAEARAAELVGMRRLEDGSLVPNPDAKWAVSNTVREQIKAKVATAVQEGWSTERLLEEIEDGPIWTSRAEMIARTETAIAVNRGATDTYRGAGVERVTVLDGPGCLEDGHDDDQRGVSGETWTLEQAQEFPVGHPHCRRDFAPLVETVTT